MGGVVVVGAGGFIGRAVLAEARRAGPAHALVGRPVPDLPDATVLRVSSRTVAAVSEVLARVRPDAVVNCAGRTSGTGAELWAANVDSVAALIEAVRGAAPGARLVHLGSAAEYAPVAGAPTAEDAPTDESTPYAAAKVAASRAVRDAATSGLEAVIARVFNPIGPGMDESSLPGRAARLLREAAEAGAGEVELGPLDAVRDYVDVRDVAAAVHRLATAPQLEHDAYNVGSGRPTEVRALVRLIAERIGFTGRVLESGAASPRSSRVPFQVAEIERIRAIGWAPAVPVSASVEALVAGAAARVEGNA